MEKISTLAGFINLLLVIITLIVLLSSNSAALVMELMTNSHDQGEWPENQSRLDLLLIPNIEPP